MRFALLSYVEIIYQGTSLKNITEEVSLHDQHSLAWIYNNLIKLDFKDDRQTLQDSHCTAEHSLGVLGNTKDR